MSSTPTLHKSTWTSKVNSFHYVIHHMSPLDVILLDHCSHCIVRCVTKGTRPREDGQGARGTKADKTVAWKRRRKRRKDPGGGSTAGLSGTTARELPPLLPLQLPPEPASERFSGTNWYRRRYRRGGKSETCPHQWYYRLTQR
jgi:hypothetical protein